MATTRSKKAKASAPVEEKQVEAPKAKEVKEAPKPVEKKVEPPKEEAPKAKEVKEAPKPSPKSSLAGKKVELFTGRVFTLSKENSDGTFTLKRDKKEKEYIFSREDFKVLD